MPTAQSYIYAFSRLIYETVRPHSLILGRIYHNYFNYWFPNPVCSLYWFALHLYSTSHIYCVWRQVKTNLA